MNFYSFRLFFALILGLTITLSSCTKEGATGPQGIPGIQGEQGEQGIEGDQGEQGPTGNANIKMYDVSVNLEDFYNDVEHGVWGVYASGTPSIQSNDMVTAFVYIDVDDNIFEWAALPMNRYYEIDERFNHFSFAYGNNGDLYFYIRNSLGGQPYNTMEGSLDFKVFVASAEGFVSNQTCDIDWNNYESVMNCYLDNTEDTE